MYLPFIFILMIYGRFALVHQACIYCVLIKLTPPVTLLFLYHHVALIFNSLQYSMLYYIHILMGCFKIEMSDKEFKFLNLKMINVLKEETHKQLN
jgi:hypothetical protein